MYLGNQPALAYTSFAKQDFTTSATTSYTLDNPVANENEIALFINFVRQEPTTAYTASGTSLTLTSATSASDDMYCVFLGKAVQTVNPPAGSVGTSQLASTAVTPAKMDLSQDYTFTGSVSGHNYPMFQVERNAELSISDGVTTKIDWDTVTFDTGSYWNETDNQYLPLVAGKYFVYAQLYPDSQADSQLDDTFLYLYKNGSQIFESGVNFNANNPRNHWLNLSFIVDMNGSTDYLDLRIFIDDDSGTPRLQASKNVFLAYRLGA